MWYTLYMDLSKNQAEKIVVLIALAFDEGQPEDVDDIMEYILKEHPDAFKNTNKEWVLSYLFRDSPHQQTDALLK